MTKLQLANYIVQLFFVRICRHETKVITGFNMTHASIDGTIGGNVKNYHIEYQYSILYWVLPFTGWFSDYIF